MLDDTPSLPTRQTARTPFGDIAYLEAGHGPAALFVHGVFLNADLWRHQLIGLAGLRRCIAVDLLAHGHSPCPPSGQVLSISLQAEMILALLDALGIDSVDLIGNDSVEVEVEGAKLLFPAERPGALNRELRDLWS